MKRFCAVLFACLCFCLTSRAQLAVSNSVTYATITNNAGFQTNVGSAVQYQSARIIFPSFSFQHGLITNTTDLTNWVDISVGSATNWVTVTNYNPTLTNSGSVDTFTLPPSSLPVYYRVRISTTNTAPGVAAGANLILNANTIP